MKVLAVLGVLFCAYAVLRILRTWNYRDRLNLAVWWVVLAATAGLCIGFLGRWSWAGILAVLVFGALIIGRMALK